MQERKKIRFAEMDRDKSGKISKAEFMAAGMVRVEAADTDRDGGLRLGNSRPAQELIFICDAANGDVHASDQSQRHSRSC
ncbi:hypothetical protein ILFOPFJJ_06627 [Ensifer psoraleae]|uniref:EF-hand domain-containing protein n=1 Tax=Sinorhizobium psoraleae TaxID=520838 RepID=UPI00156A01D8|nr:EF-hand domain-containing protein [Sinorhizobium psoraleae]NRP75704.1 hypothetical protein [Sinorhizobium psoraleae]